MISHLDTYLEALRTDPLGFLLTLLYSVVVFLLSLMLHECAHGYVAYRCGDPTAKMMGRLTLDPRKHLDLIGTVSMFLIGFGWAKPVPVNPQNYRHGRRDDFLVSIAGIATNLCLCLVCMGLSVPIGRLMFGDDLLKQVQNYSGSVSYLLSPFYTTNMNTGGADIANGTFAAEMLSQLAVPWLQYVQRFLLMMAQTNLCLAIFNFLPIPPLDGYHLFNDLLFKGKLHLNRNGYMIAQVVLIVLVLSGVLDSFLSEALFQVYGFLLKGIMALAGLS